MYASQPRIHLFNKESRQLFAVFFKEMKTSSRIFWNLICFSYKQSRQCRFSSLASFCLPMSETRPLKAVTRDLHPRASIFILERLPVRDKVLRLERARPVRDRLKNVIMWENRFSSRVPEIAPIQMKKSPKRDSVLFSFQRRFLLRCKLSLNRKQVRFPLRLRGIPRSDLVILNILLLHLLLLLLLIPPLFLPLSYRVGWCSLYRRWDACTPCRRWLWTHP